MISVLYLAGCSSDAVTGTEIEDDFIADFFRPEVEHDSVRVVETKDGKRFVVVNFGRKLDQEEAKQYQLYLAKRGMVEYSEGRHVPFRLFDFFGKREVHYETYEMLLLRPAAGEGVVEVSRNDISQPYKDKRGAVRFIGRYVTEIAVEVTPEFGHRWERHEFRPEEDVPGGDPVIGRYPGSIRVEASRAEEDDIFKYYVQDPDDEILGYYRERMERLVELRPEIELKKVTMDFATETMYGLVVRPARSEVLFLQDRNFIITVVVSSSYAYDKLKILRIEERIATDEDRAFIDRATRG